MPQSKDKKKIFFYLFIFILLSTQIGKNQNNIAKSITRINKIEVYGLSEKNNLKIKESIKLLMFENIFFINQTAISKILKQNNLIESFYVKKFYPNLIKVNIKKTKLLALTIKSNKKFYIGSNGKLISIDSVENFNKKLPFVFGSDNYINFINLKKIIDRSKFKFEEIDFFYYFRNNRWDIKTNQEFLIKLPEKNILDSLNMAYLIKQNQKISNNKIIDLRISKQIILSNE